MSALSQMSDNQKAQIERERGQAIRKALNQEADLIKQGQGTRDWTPAQQKDILDGFRPKDDNGVSYEGHHMTSVAEHPQHAGNPDNIQWLTQDEHINGAHQGSTHTPTNGYYNPETGIITPFGNEPIAPPTIKLSEPVVSIQASEMIAEQATGQSTEAALQAVESIAQAGKIAMEAVMTIV